MKIIELYGYLKGNLGDDLMLDILFKRYPDYYFFYRVSDPLAKKYRKYRNFIDIELVWEKVGRINHLLNVLTKNKKRDWLFRTVLQWLESHIVAFVSIGGSLYQQIEGEDLTQRIHREENRLWKPYFVIGANFGPYWDKKFLDEYRAFFKKCKGVSFRDTLSYNLFSDIPNCQYAPDVVFNMANSLPKETSRSSNEVIISVVDIGRKASVSIYCDEYMQAIIGICEECIEHGDTPVLVSFCEYEGDVDIINRITTCMEKNLREKTKVLCYSGDLSLLCKRIQCAKYVVATRFHAMILAMIYGVPFYAISYNYKLRNVLHDLQIEEFCEIENIRSIKASQVLSNTVQLVPPDYIHHAAEQFRQLDTFLTEKE